MLLIAAGCGPKTKRVVIPLPDPIVEPKPPARAAPQPPVSPPTPGRARTSTDNSPRTGMDPPRRDQQPVDVHRDPSQRHRGGRCSQVRSGS